MIAPRIAVTMPITNTISRPFMTKVPASATAQQKSTRVVSGAPHSACHANGRRKSANLKAACLRFLYEMMRKGKELPCKSAESAHRKSKFRRPQDVGSRKGWSSTGELGPRRSGYGWGSRLVAEVESEAPSAPR